MQQVVCMRQTDFHLKSVPRRSKIISIVLVHMTKDLDAKTMQHFIVITRSAWQYRFDLF